MNPIIVGFIVLVFFLAATSDEPAMRPAPESDNHLNKRTKEHSKG